MVVKHIWSGSNVRCRFLWLSAWEIRRRLSKSRSDEETMTGLWTSTKAIKRSDSCAEGPRFLLYVKRCLKSPIEMADGTTRSRLRLFFCITLSMRRCIGRFRPFGSNAMPLPLPDTARGRASKGVEHRKCCTRKKAGHPTPELARRPRLVRLSRLVVSWQDIR